MTETVTVPANKCVLCGHVWVQRKPGVPRQCPNPECRTTKWSEGGTSAAPLTPEERESIRSLNRSARAKGYPEISVEQFRAIQERVERERPADPFEGLV